MSYDSVGGPLVVHVGAACSGLQAMALFTGVLALFLWNERPTGHRLLMWSVVGVVGVYFANLLRLFLVVSVGHRWGSDALLRVHAQAGWVFFVAWAVLFAYLTRRSDRSR